MTKEELLFFMTYKGNIDNFNFLLKSSRSLKEDTKTYIQSNFTNNLGSNMIPKSLFKFLSFEGGILSIRNTNLQFSHPLSFRNLSNGLNDMSEFWYERFYIDNQSLEEIYELLSVKDNLSKKELTPSFLYSYLIYNHFMNTVERNKVLCLTKSVNNDYMWSLFNTGVCIEYDSKIFNDLSLIKYKPFGDKYTVFYNEIIYVDKVLEVPIRWKDSAWISNLLFVKEKEKYFKEDEFRIILTEERSLDRIISSRELRNKIAYERMFDINMFQADPIRPIIEKDHIKKVYYTGNVENEKFLLETLIKLEIPFEKIKY